MLISRGGVVVGEGSLIWVTGLREQEEHDPPLQQEKKKKPALTCACVHA